MLGHLLCTDMMLGENGECCRSTGTLSSTRKCDGVKLQKVLHLDQNTGNKLPPTLPELQNPPPTLI